MELLVRVNHNQQRTMASETVDPILALWLGEFRIQPTFALVRVVRGDLSWDINCPIPPAHCMLGLLACSEEYEFGQLGTGLSWFR